ASSESPRRAWAPAGGRSAGRSSPLPAAGAFAVSRRAVRSSLGTRRGGDPTPRTCPGWWPAPAWCRWRRQKTPQHSGWPEPGERASWVDLTDGERTQAGKKSFSTLLVGDAGRMRNGPSSLVDFRLPLHLLLDGTEPVNQYDQVRVAQRIGKRPGVPGNDAIGESDLSFPDPLDVCLEYCDDDFLGPVGAENVSSVAPFLLGQLHFRLEALQLG